MNPREKAPGPLPYVQLLTASFLWSLVGILVKVASALVNCHWISFFRFSIGAAFLLVFMAVSRVPIRLAWRHPLVWLAAAAKAVNYIFENLGITLGPAWGNLIVGPVQTVVLVLMAAALLKERLTPVKILALAACLCGVLLLRSTGAGPGLSPWIILLMVVSGIGAAVHVFLMRRLSATMESLGLNSAVFLAAGLITAVPLPLAGHATGAIHLRPILALVALGLITGLSFHLVSLSIPKIPMIQVSILSNVGFLFTPLWAYLAFGDALSFRILLGAIVGIGGIVLVSLPDGVLRMPGAGRRVR